MTDENYYCAKCDVWLTGSEVVSLELAAKRCPYCGRTPVEIEQVEGEYQ